MAVMVMPTLPLPRRRWSATRPAWYEHWPLVGQKYDSPFGQTDLAPRRRVTPAVFHADVHEHESGVPDAHVAVTRELSE